LGFILFVAPAAFLTKLIYKAAGNTAAVTLHSICYRMPVDWIFGGRWPMILGSIAAFFILGVITVSYFAGPVFCGWLCPVGSVSETVSRAAPIPNRFRFRIRDTGTVSAMRWGFLGGFAALSILMAQRIGSAWLGGISCRFCSSYPRWFGGFSMRRSFSMPSCQATRNTRAGCGTVLCHMAGNAQGGRIACGLTT
jgi:ferredoxin-type protein NapH